MKSVDPEASRYGRVASRSARVQGMCRACVVGAPAVPRSQTYRIDACGFVSQSRLYLVHEGPPMAASLRKALAAARG
jgi:hypothetical protein